LPGAHQSAHAADPSSRPAGIGRCASIAIAAAARNFAALPPHQCECRVRVLSRQPEERRRTGTAGGVGAKCGVHGVREHRRDKGLAERSLGARSTAAHIAQRRSAPLKVMGAWVKRRNTRPCPGFSWASAGFDGPRLCFGTALSIAPGKHGARHSAEHEGALCECKCGRAGRHGHRYEAHGSVIGSVHKHEARQGRCAQRSAAFAVAPSRSVHAPAVRRPPAFRRRTTPPSTDHARPRRCDGVVAETLLEAGDEARQLLSRRIQVGAVQRAPGSDACNYAGPRRMCLIRMHGSRDVVRCVARGQRARRSSGRVGLFWMDVPMARSTDAISVRYSRVLRSERCLRGSMGDDSLCACASSRASAPDVRRAVGDRRVRHRPCVHE
jgi:hypothetical protein